MEPTNLTNALFEFQDYYELFRYWTVLSVVAGMIGVPILIYGYIKVHKLKTVGILLVVNMIVSALILSLLNSIFTNRAKSELLKILEHPQVSLIVCDEILRIDSWPEVILEVKQLRNYPRHRSRPLDTLPIRIFYNGVDIKLRIQRDSDMKDEYWVFWDKYKITSDNAIGYLRTRNFEAVRCR